MKTLLRAILLAALLPVAVEATDDRFLGVPRVPRSSSELPGSRLSAEAPRGAPRNSEEPRGTDHEAAAVARLRELYRLADDHAIVREGLPLILRHPSSTELRAWYIAGLANTESEKALEMARQLRYAHPRDPWSWFATAIAQVYTHQEGMLAPESSGKMLSLYQGTDPEVFRLHAFILRTNQMHEELERYLADKTDSWALAEGAMDLDHRSWRDQTLVDAGQAALLAAEEDDPADVRLVLHHARSLAGRRRREEAMPLFERAIAMSPGSLSIRTEYWRYLGREKQDVAAADIEAFLARHSYPAALLAAQRAYRDVGLGEKAAALQQRLLADFPESVQAELAAWNTASDYMREHRGKLTPETKAEAIRYWREFIDYPFHHGKGRYLGVGAYTALFRLLKDDGPPEELLEVVDAYLAFNELHEVAAPAAEALATRGLRLDQAEKLGRIAVRDALVRLDRDATFYTKEEYAQATGIAKAIGHSALGWALLKRKKLEEAGKHLREAVKHNPKSAPARHHLGQWYEATNQLTKADETYTLGMTLERGPEAPNADALRALYVKRHGSEEGWPAYLAAAKEGTASKARREILGSRIVPARALAKPFSLKTLAGDTVSFQSLQGKVAVVKFWGVWCGPCVAEMPDFQKLVDKYANDPKVAIVTIDSDKDPETPRKFMEKHNYRFPVLLDDGWISRGAGLNSYPTAWFVGADGRIAFEKKGVSADLVNEYSWRIEALK
ncbi:MAG TPA: redoxin domain-containing protein [Thermoanaerobaculia bacterium]